jgi:hypothetical protein
VPEGQQRGQAGSEFHPAQHRPAVPGLPSQC